ARGSGPTGQRWRSVRHRSQPAGPRCRPLRRARSGVRRRQQAGRRGLWAAVTFQERLQRCCDRGDLTVADLARWFDRPARTVRSWLTQGWEPGGGPVPRRRMEDRLSRLETVVRSTELRKLSMRERAERLQQLA